MLLVLWLFKVGRTIDVVARSGDSVKESDISQIGAAAVEESVVVSD